MIFRHRLNLEPSIRSVRKVVVDKFEVVDAPDSLVAERTVAGLEHRNVRRVELGRGHIFEVLLSVEIFRHRVVGRVVVHISHCDNLDSGILLLHHHRVIVDDFTSTTSEIAALATNPRRKVGDIECKVLTCYKSVNHKDITSLEVAGVRVGKVDVGVEIERNGLAVEVGELVRFVEQGHIHATSVRAVVVDNLVVRISNLRLAHEVLDDEAVFNLGDSKYGVPAFVVVGHRTDDFRHIVEFFLILRLRPLVLSFRKELAVVLDRVVVDVKKVLEIVEPDDVVLLSFLRRCRKGHQNQESSNYK